MKKIIAIGIISMFLLASITTVSSFNLEETEVKSNQPLMINLNNYNPIVNLNDVVNFEISVNDSNGEPVSFCNYEVYTRPSEEDISCQRVGDKIVGEFTPTRDGMYSLIVEVTGADNNVKKESFFYFVNSTRIGIGIKRYYFRDDLPTHGQPTGNGHDCGSLLNTSPTAQEYRWCCSWVQFSPDEIPKNPISTLINIYIHCLCKFLSFGFAVVGIQKVATPDPVTDLNETKPFLAFQKYMWLNKDFSMSWQMNNAGDWYWLSLKILGDGPNITTKPKWPSCAYFIYMYCKNPGIESISNADVVVLSATSEAGNSNNAEIILQGTGMANLVVQMPGASQVYSANLNGVKCNNDDNQFTQVNGELSFTLNLDSEHSEHSLCIFPSKSTLPTGR